MTYSGGRLAERWERTWESMKALSVASIVVHGRGAVGNYGPVTFLTGRIPGPKGETLVMGLDQPPVTVFASPPDALAAKAGQPGLRVAHARPHEDVLEVVIRLIASAKADRAVGLVSGDAQGVPSSYLERLTALLGFAPVPYTDAFREIRLQKSPADVQSMKSAVALAERCLENFRVNYREGMSERQGAALLSGPLIEGGGALPLLFVSCNQFRGAMPGPRRLATGDLVSAAVEFAGPDGSWVELGALFAAGRLEPRKAQIVQEMFEVLMNAESALGPGRKLDVAARQTLAFIERRGRLPVEGLGHGVGIDEEPPVIAPGCRDTLSEHSLVALHPSLASKEEALAVSVANVFVMTEKGAEPLSSYPYRLHELA